MNEINFSGQQVFLPAPLLKAIESCNGTENFAWIIKDVITPHLQGEFKDIQVYIAWKELLREIYEIYPIDKIKNYIDKPEQIKETLFPQWRPEATKAHKDIAAAAYFLFKTSPDSSRRHLADKIDEKLFKAPFEDVFGIPFPTTEEDARALNKNLDTKNNSHIDQKPEGAYDEPIQNGVFRPDIFKRQYVVIVLALLAIAVGAFIGIRNYVVGSAPIITADQSPTNSKSLKHQEMGLEFLQAAKDALKIGDDEKYFELLLSANQNGSVIASAAIGVSYRLGDGVNTDPTLSEQFAKRAIERGLILLANAGDRDAAYYYGLMLLHGVGVKKQPKEGERYLNSAYSDGHTRAPLQLALIYQRNGTEEDDCTGMNLAGISRKAGHLAANAVEAEFHIGNLCPDISPEIDVLASVTTAADAGIPYAEWLLGWMYENGRGAPQSDEDAVKWYQAASDQGYASAQSDLGTMYFDGRGVPQSDDEAVKLFRKAAEQGNAHAQTDLGWMYKEGRGVPQSDEEAAQWYQKAADQGYARAQTNLGWMFQEGHGVPQSDEYAVKWYRAAANQGQALAQSNLGAMYFDGQGGVPQSDDEAVKLFRKAAEQGNARAQTDLGWMYEKGRGVPQSDEEALKWYRAAAKQGYDRAEASIGWMYEIGEGVPQSDEEAVEWYQKAADQGNARAQSNLGIMYFKGRGVPQSDQEAANWFKKAADQGNARAQTDLAWMHEKGRGVSKSFEIAKEWYEAAAKQDYARAQNRLGELYMYGLGVEQDLVKAFSLFEKAKNADYDISYYNIGLLYEFGTSETKRNLNKAKDSFIKASELGYADAFTKLGWYEKEGALGKVNFREAEKYFEKGIQAGSNWAKASLGRMYVNSELDTHSFEHGVDLCRDARDEGNVCAGDYCIGLAYFSQKSSIVAKDEAEASLRRSARTGNRCAQTILGVALATNEFSSEFVQYGFLDLIDKFPGQYFRVNLETSSYLNDFSRLLEANFWLQNAAARGEGSEQFNYAIFLVHYLKLPSDSTHVVRLLTEAAERGHRIANCSMVAHHLFKEDGFSDPIQAAPYLTRLMKTDISREDANMSLRDPDYFSRLPIAGRAFAHVFTAPDLADGVIYDHAEENRPLVGGVNTAFNVPIISFGADGDEWLALTDNGQLGKNEIKQCVALDESGNPIRVECP